MRVARVHLQRAVLEQLDRQFGRVCDRDDLVVVAVHHQGGDLDGLEVFGEVGFRERLDPLVATAETLAFGSLLAEGHSVRLAGGAVITEAGTHDNVAALVYIAGFAPDKGESVNTLIADPPPGAPVPPILPPRDGFLLLDRDKFHDSFAADLSAEQARFLADSQVPWGVGALGGSVTEPAWRVKPSWYLVTTEDRMIPPAAQRTMSERAGSTVVDADGSHAIYVSQPQAVADIIKQAASA